MNKKKILITGASGFIGINCCKLISKSKYKIFGTYLKKKKFKKFKNVKYIKCDLTSLKNCQKITKNIDIVIMCAANSSGANVIINNPLSHFTPNIIMNTNILQSCYDNKVKKFIFISSNTVYPNSKKKMEESDSKFIFFDKYYIVGWMKKFSEIACDIFTNKVRESLNTIIIRPGNLYGPYDKFNEKESKVIPALIRRSIKKENPFEVWGDGRELKDFLYIDDFVKGLIKLINYNKKFDIFNLSFGKSISIRNTLEIILNITKFRPKIIYNKSKPSLIKFRNINNKKALNKINWKPTTDLRLGLKKTINWYKDSLKK